MHAMYKSAATVSLQTVVLFLSLSAAATSFNLITHFLEIGGLCAENLMEDLEFRKQEYIIDI